MESLRFIVKGQIIKKDPESPFRNMVAGSSNYYAAEFDMDSAWTGYACLAHFLAKSVDAYVPIVNKQAIIPDDVLKYKNFYVGVVGQKGTSRLLTNVNKITQNGGIS